MGFAVIQNRTRPRVHVLWSETERVPERMLPCTQSTDKGVNQHSEDVQTEQQRPERLPFDDAFLFEDVPLVEFTYLVFTCMPVESWYRRLRSLLLCLSYSFWALINSLVLPCTKFWKCGHTVTGCRYLAKSVILEVQQSLGRYLAMSVILEVQQSLGYIIIKLAASTPIDTLAHKNNNNRLTFLS